MPNVFPGRVYLEVLHIGLEYLHLDAGQAEHGSMIVDELPHERSRAPESFRFLLDGGGLFGREAEGLCKVIVSRWRFGHWICSLSIGRVASLHQTIVNLKMDFKRAVLSVHWDYTIQVITMRRFC